MNFDNDKEIKSIFGLSSSLAELDSSSLMAITRAAVRRSYRKGEIVCLEGQACLGLIIVESGWLSSVKISPKGREQEIRLTGPGDIANIISTMTGDLNLVTLKTLEDAKLWIIDRKKLFELMAEYPGLGNFITQKMANVIVQLLNLVEDLSLRNVEGRLANLLLTRSKDGVVHRKEWSTQEQMAASIGTTSVVLSRILNEMQNQGAISIDRHEIQILDYEILETTVFLNNK
jgi:CRP/FNR family transcriptional regulator